MLAAIQSFIESAIHPQSISPEERERGLRLAAAALLVEVSAADYSRDPAERTAIAEALRTTFDLEEKELQQLLDDAERRQKDATSLYEFTSVINDRCSHEEKYGILINLWRVAFADGKLDKYEDQRIRRIADLLYLSHSDFIRAKLQVTA